MNMLHSSKIAIMLLSGTSIRKSINNKIKFSFLNPFEIPRRLNEMIWQEITMKNRIFLAVGTLLFVLYGLFNLQKREKFI